jgi:hypothetical protein
MSYGHPAVCRRGGGIFDRPGCNQPAMVNPNLQEGDRGFCPAHLEAVRERRDYTAAALALIKSNARAGKPYLRKKVDQ